MALALMSGGASTAGQIPAMGNEAIRQSFMQMAKNPAFINSALRSYGGAYGEARDAGGSRITRYKRRRSAGTTPSYD